MRAIFLCSSDACWGVLGEDMLMGIFNVSLISWIFDQSRYSLSLEGTLRDAERSNMDRVSRGVDPGWVSDK